MIDLASMILCWFACMTVFVFAAKWLCKYNFLTVNIKHNTGILDFDITSMRFDRCVIVRGRWNWPHGVFLNENDWDERGVVKKFHSQFRSYIYIALFQTHRQSTVVHAGYTLISYIQFSGYICSSKQLVICFDMSFNVSHREYKFSWSGTKPASPLAKEQILQCFWT